MADDVFAVTTQNRLRLADLLDRLTDEQWEAPSLCAGWRVREVAGHLLQPFEVGFGRFFVAALRFRGDTDRVVDHYARVLARRPPEEIVGALRARAAARVSPLRVGPMGPFAETCVHLRDIARPLGLADDVLPGHWRLLLDYLTSEGVAPALVPPGRLDGLRMEAADGSWSRGEGALLAGPLEALGMAVTGRTAALADLAGPGVELLRRRLR